MAPNINDTIERFLNLSCPVVSKQVSHGTYISQRAILIDCLRQRWLGEKDGYTPGFKLTYKVEDGRLITQRYNQQPKRPSVALGLVLVEHK